MNKIIVFIIFCLILLLFSYIYYQCKWAKEVKQDIYSKKIKNKIKITQISDFHSNKLKNMEYFKEKILEFNPDFIILTGDINDYGEEKKFNRAIDFLEKLSKLEIKTYYITGNHEEAGPMLDEFIEQIKRIGIKYLKNEGEYLKIRDENIYIYGVSYNNFSLKNYQTKDENLNIILSHFSKNIRDNLDDTMDIIFSGHTHGGQVRFPFLGALLAPGEGYFPKFDKGLFKYKNSQIYIDSGLGNTFMDLRFLNRIQFSNITIMRQ